MIYLTLGEGIRQGVPLYSHIHDNKPPLLYIVAAISGNLFVFKAILAFWHLLTVYGFWKLVKHLFPKNTKLQNVSTVIFGILTTIPLFEGNIANAELFMIGPVIFAFWILLSKESSIKNLLTAGVLFSIASLFKIPAIFDIFGIFVLWLVGIRFTKSDFVKDFKSIFYKVFFVLLGLLIPIVLSFVYYYLAGSFKEYLVAAYLQNFGYVSSWRNVSEDIPFLVKNGPLLIRFAIMLVGFIILWLLNKKLSKPFIFVTAWLLATLFAVALSERPYPHYFVQSLAPVSILFGMLLTLQSLEQTLTVIPLTLAFFVPFYFKFWYYPTLSYYQRFIDFSIGKITKQEYFDKFSKNTNENYEIASFLTKAAKKDESVFVWSNDSSTIYALSRKLPPTKYVADYHFIDFSTSQETISILKEKMPKFVIITNNAYPFPELNSFVNENYYIISERENSQIWLNIKNNDRDK